MHKTSYVVVELKYTYSRRLKICPVVKKSYLIRSLHRKR